MPPTNPGYSERLLALLQEARDSGAEIVELEDGATADRKTRRMPLSLVIDPSDQSLLMNEEIFGPILPIKPYDSVDEVIAYVNAGERPLGLYVFGQGISRAERVLAQTTSGGACINACGAQARKAPSRHSASAAMA